MPDERCNGITECGDHSDERNCNPELCRSERGGFLCSNRQCIRESWQCDQTNDCGDDSDEMNCKYSYQLLDCGEILTQFINFLENFFVDENFLCRL